MTAYEYTDAGTDALGNESVFAYNANDQLVSMDLHRVDGVNDADEHQVTLYEYDGRNLVTKEINAAGGNTLYVYDGNGNMVSKTDGDGYVTEYSYNSLDLVSHISYNGSKEVSYQYNKVGELVKMDDWLGATTFELDLLNQLKKVTDHKGNVVEYTYDEVGNQLSLTYPDKSSQTKSYDALGQLTQTTDGDGGKYTYTYDDAGNVSKLTYPNGWVEEYTYDAEGNLLKTVDTDPFLNNKKSTKYQYTYDAEGNLITEYQRDSDGEAGLAANTTYTYDALNRLTGSKKTLDWTRKTYAKTYIYDSLGNLVRENGPDSRDQTTYQYNSLNQMAARKECGYVQSITRIHDYGYTYDGRGNLIKEEEICSPTTQGPKNITIAAYTYDETNKMVSGTNKDGEVSNYTFNGLGVRVGTEVIVKDNTHGYTDFHCQTPTVETGIDKPEVVLSDYVIDYTRLNIDQRVLVESETDGYDFRYTYGLDLVNVKATGEGTSWWAQSVKKCVYSDYVHTDRLGSVVNLTDQYGRVPAQIDYDDWGKVTAYQSLNISGGYRTVLPEITYAGHQYDDVLGMYYAKARMYDAENRRFAAVDPVKGNITEPMTLVQYLYVVDNPLRWVDLLGHVATRYLFNGKEVTLDVRTINGEAYASIRSLSKAYGAELPISSSQFLYPTVGGKNEFHTVYSNTTSHYPHINITMDMTARQVEFYNEMSKVKHTYKPVNDNGSYFMPISCFQGIMANLGYRATLDKVQQQVYANNIQVGPYNGLGDKEKESNALYIYDFLSERGWSMEAVAGLLGNVSCESGFNPGAWQDESRNPNSSNIGYGIVQFTPANNFLSWAKLSVSEAAAMATANPNKLMDLQGVKIEPCKWVWAKKNVGRIDVQPKRATLRSDPTQAARYTAENGGRNAAVFRVQPLPPSG